MIMTLIKNKKANITDTAYIVAVLFAIAIVMIIIYTVWNNIGTELNNSLKSATPDGDTTFNFTKSTSDTKGAILQFDNVYPLLMIGLFISTLISAFFIKSSPIFFVLSIIVLLIVIMLSAIMGNVYEKVSGDNDTSNALKTAGDDFIISKTIIKNLPLIIVIIGGLISLALLFKPTNNIGL